MNGKENIINKILSDADERSARIISDAEKQAADMIAAAHNAVERDREALELRLSAVREQKLRNARSNAELDARKYRLLVRQQLVALCYDRVYEHLAHMKDEDRLDLVGELLSRYAEQGETVYVTFADARLVTQLWLDGFDKGLKLGSRRIRADGGIVLEGEGYEKDLTLPRVVQYLRERTEARVADLLGVRNE